MAARPRSRTKRDWPKGLREPKPGYYGWENPETGKFLAIGRVTLAEAKLQALEANLHIAKAAPRARLVDKLTGAATLTLEQWLEEWLERLKEKGDKAENTLKSYRSLARAVAAEPAGKVPLAKCSVEVIAGCLESIASSRGARTSQATRAMLKTAFNAAIAKGKCDANPVLVTESIAVEVQRQRFTWETFLPVWEHLEQHGPVWLRNATALALVSAQRREDVAGAMFRAFTDSEWLLEQEKTGRRLALPLELRLDTFGMSLRDVVQACRRTGAVSKYLVHQTKGRGNSPVGAAINLNTITKQFTAAVAAVHGDDPTLPTFHELRSLAKRLYIAQGGVDTKALLGHATEEMAALYANARGAEFERVAVKNSATNSEPIVNRGEPS